MVMEAFNYLVFVDFSIIGSVMIICGLYVVLWGKSKEMMKKAVSSESTHKLDTVEIMVKPAVEKKSNNSNSQANEVIAVGVNGEK